MCHTAKIRHLRRSGQPHLQVHRSTRRPIWRGRTKQGQIDLAAYIEAERRAFRKSNRAGDADLRSLCCKRDARQRQSIRVEVESEWSGRAERHIAQIDI